MLDAFARQLRRLYCLFVPRIFIDLVSAPTRRKGLPTRSKREHRISSHGPASDGWTCLGEDELEVGRGQVASTLGEGREETDLRHVLHAEFVEHRILVENNLPKQVPDTWRQLVGADEA